MCERLGVCVRVCERPRVCVRGWGYVRDHERV